MEMLGPTKITTVLGMPLAWTEYGEGSPLVLLHGMGDSHRTWRNAAPTLAKHHRVIMLDLPGHGLSSRPDAPYTLDWYARTVFAWLDAIGIERTHLVGHSFGGGVAQWMLLLDRSRIDRLALVAAGGLGREVTAGLRLVALPTLSHELVQPFMGVGTRAIMHLASHDHSKIDRGEIHRAAWLNAAPGSGLAFQRTVAGCIDLFGQNVQTWDRIDQVAELPPIALFWGEKDRIIPIRHGYNAKERISGALFSAYPEVGHFPQIEASDRFARELVEFFDDSVLRAAPHVVVRARGRSRSRLRARWTARIVKSLRAWIARHARPRPNIAKSPARPASLLALPPASV